jgi:hypothetical protein
MNWKPITQLPTDSERKMLLWIEWPECGWPLPPELVIGWWKHGPQTFSFDMYEFANHLVKFWAEIEEPT